MKKPFYLVLFICISTFAADTRVNVSDVAGWPIWPPITPIPSGGKIIGRWFEPKQTWGYYTYYQRKGQYFMRMAFPDNSFADAVVRRKQVWNGLRLTEVGNTNGEYYILVKDGSLGFYNKEGKRFTTAQSVK